MVRDEMGRSGATGRRKTAVARVTIWPGDGEITVNKRPLDDHVPDINHRGAAQVETSFYRELESAWFHSTLGT
jgi:ribosomal protein S9